jgi:predicted CopG family antitoxin
MSGSDHRIRINDKVWDKLNRRKQPGDSFNDVIERLLNEVE